MCVEDFAHFLLASVSQTCPSGSFPGFITSSCEQFRVPAFFKMFHRVHFLEVVPAGAHFLYLIQCHMIWFRADAAGKALKWMGRRAGYISTYPWVLHVQFPLSDRHSVSLGLHAVNCWGLV